MVNNFKELWFRWWLPWRREENLTTGLFFTFPLFQKKKNKFEVKTVVHNPKPKKNLSEFRNTFSMNSSRLEIIFSPNPTLHAFSYFFSFVFSGHRKTSCYSLLHSNFLYTVIEAISLITLCTKIYFSFYFFKGTFFPHSYLVIAFSILIFLWEKSLLNLIWTHWTVIYDFIFRNTKLFQK